MKLKPQFLLIVLVFVLTPIVLILFSLLRPAEDTQKPAGGTPTSASPTPSSIPIPTDVLPEKILEVIRVAPVESPNITYSHIQPIEITFNNAVDVRNIKYSISPTTSVVVKNGTYPNKILIYPATTWVNGITKVIIEPGSIALDGALLYSRFSYQIVASAPSEPPIVEGDY